MRKILKIIFASTAVIFLTLMGSYGYIMYRNNKFMETAVSYVEQKYGIETSVVDIKDVYNNPISNWSKDILLVSNNDNNFNICVRVNRDGTVYSDDYYYYILENKLKERFNDKVNQIWNESSELSVHIPIVSVNLSLLNGEHDNRMNKDLNAELLGVMDKEIENINVEKIKNILPNYYLVINVITDNDFVEDDEYKNAYEIVDYLKQNEFVPEFISIYYNYQGNCIKYVSIDSLESIKVPEDVKNYFDKDNLSY